jgi:hypothetical protein
MTRLPETKFTISFPAELSTTPITGRMFLVITKSVDRPYIVASGPGEVGGSERGLEPRFQAGAWKNRVPFFGTYQKAVPYFSPWVGSVPFFAVDVEGLAPGASAVVDGDTLGFPPKSLRDIPAGDYFVQAVLNVYTEFHRSDGHVIWAHMDQWEGQHWNHSAGNPISKVPRVHLDPDAGYEVHLDLVERIPEPTIPADTEWVRQIKFKSELLSTFWGQPIHLGATALLPKGYDEHPDECYPVIYAESHFSLGAPFGFSPTGGVEGEEQRYMRSLRGLESGHEFYQAWNSDDFPRVIIVQTQHPTPYFDSSYAVDSANNGPYGRAFMNELLPRVEEAFRIIREPWARATTGGSTGGWVSLALQVQHPKFFGGAWSFAPDPADLRRYGLINIYDDDNAFTAPNREWLVPERIFYRSPDGQPEITMRQISQFEAVLGSKGRSSEQLDIWQAAFGPVGDDGYPRPLWDKTTGVIDHDVANYMRDHGCDLRHYLEENWVAIGPDLVGKLHIFCADMDDYYLNLGVYPLEEFLESTTDPYYAGSFTYGRPLDGHVWHPMTHADLVRTMARHMKDRGRPRRHYASVPSRVAGQMAGN